METKRKEIILKINDVYGNFYCSNLLNDSLLDQLNIKQEDIKEVKLNFTDMPGYFYCENIPSLGYTTVGGGSIGFDLITYTKGTYQLQPFLRYDKGHKEGLKEEHLNPKLRVIHNNKQWYLPDRRGENIFGEGLPHIITPVYPIEWNAYNSDEPNKTIMGKIVDKIKIKPETTKKVYSEEN